MAGAHHPLGAGWHRGTRAVWQGDVLETWQGSGTPPGERSPRGPRLTAWYPADDITVQVSMATASHGRLGSRSYVTAQAAGRWPHMAPVPRPTAPDGWRSRTPGPSSPRPHGTGPARPHTTGASSTLGCPRSNPWHQQHPQLAVPPPPPLASAPHAGATARADITQAAGAGPWRRSPSPGDAAARNSTGRGPGLVSMRMQHGSGRPSASHVAPAPQTGRS